MVAFHFSRRAEADLLEIGSYTLQTWGVAQAIRYIDQLEACCQRLAGNPTSGRSCDDVRPGLRHMEHGKHVIFYRQQQRGGIVISRILHQRMLPGEQPSTTQKDKTLSSCFHGGVYFVLTHNPSSQQPTVTGPTFRCLNQGVHSQTVPGFRLDL